MLAAVRRFIDREALFASDRRLLIAVSGGADSTALFHLLRLLAEELELALGVVHVHHHLRADAADADAVFVESLCSEWDVPFFLRPVDTEAVAHARGISIEMAARDLRHEAYAEVLKAFAGDAVVLGHHADDQIETVLLRILSGTAPRGMGGMRPRTTLKGMVLLRPLLEVARAEVLAWMQEQGHAWREDQSNCSDAFLRNRIRHEVLPMLRDRINPAAGEHLARLAERVAEDDAALQSWCGTAYTAMLVGDGVLDTGKLMAQPPALQKRIVFQYLREQGVGRGVTSDFIQRVLDLCTTDAGSQHVEIENITFVRSYDQLRRLSGAESTGFSHELIVPGETVLPGPGLRCTTRRVERPVLQLDPTIANYPLSACLNPDRLAGKLLIIRNVEPGDRFAPLGLEGHRKLKDVLIDAKLPRDQRASIPVIVVEGEIIWVPGYQVARGWEVRDFKSPALCIQIDKLL